MIHCTECNKKLGVLQGYRHPALGKKFPICHTCFKKIDQDMHQWSTFCYSDTHISQLSKVDLQAAWNKQLSNNPTSQAWFTNLWNKIESKATSNTI